MIEILGQWVKNVTIILLLALFLDLLIPNNNLKRYVRLVIGLLIIMTIISPLIRIFDINNYKYLTVFDSNDNNLNKSIPNLDKIFNDSEQVQSVGIKQTKSILEDKLAVQIEGLCSVIDSIEKIKAVVKLSNALKPDSVEKIESIILEVTVKNDTVQSYNDGLVKPIIINNNHNAEEEKQTNLSYNKEKKKELGAKLKTIISSFYGIDKKQIQINFN